MFAFADAGDHGPRRLSSIPGAKKQDREPGGQAGGKSLFLWIIPPSRAATLKKRNASQPVWEAPCSLNPPGSSVLLSTGEPRPPASSPAGRPLEKVGTQLGRCEDCARIGSKA